MGGGQSTNKQTENAAAKNTPFQKDSTKLGKEDNAYRRSVLNFTRAAFRWNESDVAITRFLADDKGRALFISYMKDSLGGEEGESEEAGKLLSYLANLDSTQLKDKKFLETIKPLMEMKAFETFLNSSHFNGWLASNQGLFNSMHADKIYETMEKEEGAEKTVSIQSDAQADARKAVTESLALAALRLVDDKESAVFVSNGASWLSSMLAAAEFIPLPFTIATANPAAGFPLIYVNPCFEKLTGYKKEEIVGRNCNFLQTDNTTGKRYYSTTSVETGRMSMKLRGGLPVTSRLKNFKKDGTPFYNRLVMHPLFDQKMNYRYVIGLQLEVSDHDSVEATNTVFKNEKLMTLLPKFFYDNTAEEEEQEGDCGAVEQLCTAPAK